MKTKCSAISRRLRAGVALRALAGAYTSPGDLRSGNNPGERAAGYFPRYWTAAVAALGLMAVAPTSSHAQAPPLGTAASFAILAGTEVTNIGPSVVTGNVGIFAGSLCTGFTAPSNPPCVTPGLGIVNGTVYAADPGGVAAQAQADNLTAYLNLAGRPPTAILTGQNLGGLTLTPGVYFFAAAALLSGPVALTLNGLGNPNSVFIFNIMAGLTTGPGSSVVVSNGAQGGNVFWRVGSTATLDTTTAFVGHILASTSITLADAASLNCGSAWAQTGNVTLINNVITICNTIAASAASVLPATATANQRAVANAIDAFVANGGTLPASFQTLLTTLSPAQLAAAFSQLSGEAGTGAAQAGTQAMNSFLSLVTNPFADRFAPERPRQPLIVKAPVYKGPPGAAPDPRRWGIWGAGYGGQSNAAGDVFGVGSHDRSVRTYGFATGLDYRVTPNTIVGFALAGGGTNYALTDGLGGGRSHMFQAAVYSSTRINAAYVSAAVAYAWHRVSTDRYVTVLGSDHFTSEFSAHNVGGRIEGGYRFAIPNVLALPGQYGFTPYAAGQVQAFRTPSYNESVASGSPDFALAYSGRTTTTVRTELGAWFDWTTMVDHDTIVTLRTRAAWAHDHWSDPSVTASFQALPGSSFTVTGAAPAKDLLLASAGAEIAFRTGFSLGARFDGEFAQHSQKYAGTGWLRYTW